MSLFKPNIGKMKAKGDIPGLEKALGHKEQKIRSEAMEALVETGEPAVESLTETLQHADRDLREQAARTLGKIGSAQAKESLVRALRDEDSGVRQEAVQALDQLSWVPRHATERAYYWIAKKEWAALAGLGEAAVEPLIEALDFNEVHNDAALTLGRIGDPRAIDPLIRAMRKEMEVAALAVGLAQSLGANLMVSTATALTRLGEPAIEPLIQALGEEDVHTRSGAILALAGMGESAIGPLTRASGSSNELVRTSAAQALEQIGPAPGAKQVCSNCGAEMGPEKKFCTQCGTKLHSED